MGSLTVNQASTTTAIVNAVNPSVFGQSVTFTATVSPVAPGAGTRTGTVTFYDGITALGANAVDAAGHATLTTSSLAVGSHSISAVYSGDSNFVGSTSAVLTQVVNKADTTTTITNAASLGSTATVVGQSYSVSVAVNPIAPGAGTPTGTVTVSDGSATCTVTLSGGIGSCTLSSTSAGAKTLTATYNADLSFAGSSITASHTVNQASTTTAIVNAVNPSVFGQSVTFTATVSPVAPGAGTRTGTVTFYDGITALGANAVDAAGHATLTTSSLAVGSHSISAVYSGDSNFVGSTSAVLTQVVNKADTTTTITNAASLGSTATVVGQSYSVSVAVNPIAPGAGTPTGTVTVSDGSATCTVTLSGGIGSCTLSSTSAGAKTLTATYNADLSFAGSSITASHTVNPRAASISVSCSAASVVVGQSTTCNANVSDAEAAGTAQYPTGTITFSSNGAGTLGTTSCSLTQIGTTTTSTCAVTYTPTNAALATHTITGTYLGSTVHKTNSGTFGLAVGKRSTSTVVTCSPMVQPINQSITCTATVTDTQVVGTASFPTGTVNFTRNGSAAGSCSLAMTNPTTSACSVASYGSAISTVDSIAASYAGSTVHLVSPSAVVLIVFYDASNGFVTGGGWITSPVGACKLTTICQGATGKANFGFVSQYKKGANVPTGNTEFQFQAGNLNFHSEVYEWLVISGGFKAQYKGTGTINGIGGYGFILTAIDGDQSGGSGVDKFRIKIWDNNNGGAIVYDNQTGGSDTADPTTMISGGSIVIHK